MQDVREIANNPPVDENLEILLEEIQLEEQMADFYEDLKERMRIRQEKQEKLRSEKKTQRQRGGILG